LSFAPHIHTDRPTHISTSILFSLTTIITITEAKAFNAALADFKKKGAEVFGISSVRTATICLGRVGERGREGGKEGGREGRREGRKEGGGAC